MKKNHDLARILDGIWKELNCAIVSRKATFNKGKGLLILSVFNSKVTIFYLYIHGSACFQFYKDCISSFFVVLSIFQVECKKATKVLSLGREKESNDTFGLIQSKRGKQD